VTAAGETLTASPGVWTGTDPISFAYVWQRCDGLGQSCADVPGPTGAAYALGADDLGSTIRVVVTATNAAGSASAPATPTAVVTAGAPELPQPPAVASPPAVSGDATDGETLTASSGAWTGTVPLAYAYEWLRCNASGLACTAVAGATGETLVLGPADVGATIQVLVTATNAAGSASAASTPTAAVAPAPPAIAQPPTISGTAMSGSTLLAASGTWNGTPPLVYV
jgi:hypothetical protein